MREDDLTRNEINCLVNCYNKYYRYLAFSNTLYTYLIGGDKIDKFLGEDEIDNNETGAANSAA